MSQGSFCARSALLAVGLSSALSFAQNLDELESYETHWSGISMGGYGALRVALSNPGLASSVGALCGPYELMRLARDISIQFKMFDRLPIPPEEIPTRIDMLHDLFTAMGNPFSEGVPAAALDLTPFAIGEKTLPGIYFRDRNRNGQRDIGEEIAQFPTEPFDDRNGDGVLDPDEPYHDVGLDGVSGTGDMGEMDGGFTIDPDIDRWIDRDVELQMIRTRRARIEELPIYFDCGRDDEYGFFPHAEGMFESLRTMIPTAVRWEKPADDPRRVVMPSHLFSAFPGGHTKPLGTLVERMSQMVRFLSNQMAEPRFLTDDEKNSRGRFVREDFTSEALGSSRSYLLYLPPGYEQSAGRAYPLVIFLTGYGSTLEDTEGALAEMLLNWLVSSRYLARSLVLFPDPEGIADGRVRQGSFYIDHPGPDGGRYGTALLENALDVARRYRVSRKSVRMDPPKMSSIREFSSKSTKRNFAAFPVEIDVLRIVSGEPR